VIALEAQSLANEETREGEGAHKQIHIAVGIDSACEGDALFLATREIDALLPDLSQIA